MLDRLSIRASPDIESDSFSDLLVVEKAIEHLFYTGVLDEVETKILYAVGENPTWQEVGEVVDLDRNQCAKIFHRVCEIIGKYLGGDFDDEEMIDRLAQEHPINKNEIRQKMKDIINAK